MRRAKSPPPPPWLVEGAMVDYHAVIGEPPTEFNLRARTSPQRMSSGHWVVWLDGKAGCVSVEACSPATGSLGPSNDDSPAVQVEMRASELVGTGFGLMAGAEIIGYRHHEDQSFTPAGDELAGWLAREINEERAGDPDRDATAWAWDTSRPIAEQLAETAADDAAADALVDEAAVDVNVAEINEPDGAL